MMSRLAGILGRFIRRRPWWIIGAVVVLSAAAVPGITLIEMESGISAMVSSSSTIVRDDARYQEQFGGSEIIVLLEGDIDYLFGETNLTVMGALEAQVASDDRYLGIAGPLTVLHAAVEEASAAQQQMEEQLVLAQQAASAAALEAAAAQGLGEAEQAEAARQAAEAVLAQFAEQIAQAQSIGEPSLDNAAFIAAVLYDSEGNISEAMRPFVPDTTHTVLYITPRGNMPDEEALKAVTDIEMFFSLREAPGQRDVSVISGPKLVNAISEGIGTNMMIMLGLSVAAMIVILLVIFRVRWRLLSLLMVGVSALWTFGVMGYAGVPLTMATMAVLPILIGLGIDYSIQFHNRYQEEITRQSSVGEAVVIAVEKMLPTVSIALLATIIGFITLYISEIPMIRDFGLMLAVGIILSCLAGLFLLCAVVYLGDRKADLKKLRRASEKAAGRIESVLGRVGSLALHHRVWILIIAVVFAVGGGVADRFLPTNTDYEELMPQDTPELVELREARGILGSGGSLVFLVEADDVTSPEVLGWMNTFGDAALADYPELLSVTSPASVVAEAAGGAIPPEPQLGLILEAVPQLSLGRVVSADRTSAVVSFATVYMPLEDIHELLKEISGEAELPAGVTIAPVGTTALGASVIDAIVGSRMKMNFICLGAVLLVLLLVYRRIRDALFNILAVGAVIAWSSLDMFLAGIPLNPITAIMGVLIIGICTEFMVLLLGRYEEEKSQGLPPEEAMVTAIAKIGRAIVTTALTTLGGFAVLIASDFVMIRDFGIATVLGVTLCLVMTLTVMPGLIVWEDNIRARIRKKRSGGES